jgi:hypothetical protein
MVNKHFSPVCFSRIFFHFINQTKYLDIDLGLTQASYPSLPSSFNLQPPIPGLEKPLPTKSSSILNFKGRTGSDGAWYYS